jgi:hypothetical protein
MFGIFKDKKKLAFVKSSYEGVKGFSEHDGFANSLNTIIDKERFKFVLGIYCINYMNYLIFITKSIEEVREIFPIIVKEFNTLFISDKFCLGDMIRDDWEKRLCCNEFNVSTFDEIKGLNTNMCGLLNAVFNHRKELTWPEIHKLFQSPTNSAEYPIVSSLSRQFCGNDRDAFLLFSHIYMPMISIINLSYQENKW